jgi:hypothetical protein
MYKVDFELLVNDFSAEFDRFFGFIIKDLDVAESTAEELEPLREELFKFFTTILIDSIAKAMTDEDRVETDSYLELHPEVNAVEVYIQYALANPEINKILDESIADAVSTIRTLKDNN